MREQSWFRGSGPYLLGFFISLLSAIKRSSSKIKKKTTSVGFDLSTQTLDTRPESAPPRLSAPPPLHRRCPRRARPPGDSPSPHAAEQGASCRQRVCFSSFTRPRGPRPSAEDWAHQRPKPQRPGASAPRCHSTPAHCAVNAPAGLTLPCTGGGSWGKDTEPGSERTPRNA